MYPASMGSTKFQLIFTVILVYQINVLIQENTLSSIQLFFVAPMMVVAMKEHQLPLPVLMRIIHMPLENSSEAASVRKLSV